MPCIRPTHGPAGNVSVPQLQAPYCRPNGARRHLAAAPAREPDAPAPAAQSFLPVMLLPPALPSPAKASTIEIVIAGGRTVRVGTDVDTAVLVRIIAALEAHR